MHDNIDLSLPCFGDSVSFAVMIELQEYRKTGELRKEVEDHTAICERCLHIYERTQERRAFQCPMRDIISEDPEITAWLMQEIFLMPNKYAAHLRDCSDCEAHYRLVHEAFQFLRSEKGQKLLKDYRRKEQAG
jgi:hypothetical protein